MISATLVKELREKTGAGMMDCKKALTETNGEFEAAVDWLRKKGLSQAAKKADRITAEGLTAVKISGNTGSIIEVNSETDFVARNELFQNLVTETAQLAIESNNLQELGNKLTKSGATVNAAIVEGISTIGENISLRRMDTLTVNQGVIAAYVHNSVIENLGKISVLVALESAANNKTKLHILGKQIAMHIAATNPKSLQASDLDPALINKEKEIFFEQSRASGKPDNIIEKMVDGRIRKFLEEVVLLEQTFVIDGKTKISELLVNASKELGATVTLTKFVRFELGEGIELENKNFADEVAALTHN